MHNQLSAAAAAAGFGFGLSLIVAIGAQNAFILRQGILRQHVGPLVAICVAADAALIGLGIVAIGTVRNVWPGAVAATAWVGGAFLVAYGLFAARRALRPSHLDPRHEAAGSLRTAVLTCLGLTFLNPHVYLDTVLLLGAVGNGYGAARWYFGLGAATASVLWFSGLGFGARLLDGVFARPRSWRVLDIVIAVTMTTLGVRMLGMA